MKQATETQSENESEDYRNAVHQILLDLLDQDNSLSRCCAVQALTEIGATDDAAQQRLIELLRDPDPDVRLETAYALGELKKVDAIEPLVFNLENDPEGDVRIQAVTALGKIASAQSFAPLIRCLEQDGYPQLDHYTGDMEFPSCCEVQSQALGALGKLGDPRSIAPIIKLLENDEYDYIQEQGFRVLAQIDGKQALSFLIRQLKQGGRLARRRAAQALSSATIFSATEQIVDQEFPMEVLTALSQALSDPDSGVRLNVARALGQTNNPLISASLILLLNDPDADVRHEVARLLGKMQGSEILERLHALLGEAKANKKASIVHVLGEIADPGSVEILTSLLDTDDSDLLYEVVWALGECRLPAPKIQLATILANEKIDPGVRIQAAQSLGKLLSHRTPAELRPQQKDTSDNNAVDQEDEPQQCVPQDVLTKTIYNRHVGVSYAALDALVEIDPEAAQIMLINLLCTTIPIKEEEQTRQDADNVTVNTLEELTEHRPELVEQFHLDASPENSTVAAILAASSSEQIEAHESLENEQPATDYQTDAGARKSKPSPHERIQILAARLLGNNKEPDAEAITALMHCAANENTALRYEAILSLGRIKAECALPVIRQALSSKHRDIKLAALEALGQFKSSALEDIEFENLHTDPDADVRCGAMQFMLAIDLPQTRETICQAMRDENIEVCRTALKASTHTSHHPEYSDRITDLMFGFSGELRKEAAAALRRAGNYDPTPHLLKMLADPDFEEFHWICIDVLAEMYSVRPDNSTGAIYAA